MLSNEELKQIFFHCNNKSPDGCFADDVDILEFGHKVAALAVQKAVKAEREKCIEFVMSLNTEVGKALSKN